MSSRGVQKVSRSARLSQQALAHVLNHLATHDLPLQTLKNLGKIPTLSRSLRNSFPKSKRTARNVLLETATPQRTLQDLVRILVKIKADQTKKYRVGRWTFVPFQYGQGITARHQLYWLGPPGPMFGFKYTVDIWSEDVQDVSPVDIVGMHKDLKRIKGEFHPFDHQGFKDFIRRVCVAAHAMERTQAREMATELQTLLQQVRTAPKTSHRVGRWRYDPQFHQVYWLGPLGLMFGYVFARPMLNIAHMNARRILNITNATAARTSIMPNTSQSLRRLVSLAHGFVSS